MYPEPTGRVVRTGQRAFDLILTRTFAEPPESVWTSFTDPILAARWIGRWDGSPGRGQETQVQMLYEDGQPVSRVHIVDCVRPSLLRLMTEDEYGTWDLEVRFRPDDGGTALEFVHHLEDPAAAESTGPGWEYYLDRLSSARSGGTAPDFGDYYPRQGRHYAAQARAASDLPT